MPWQSGCGGGIVGVVDAISAPGREGRANEDGYGAIGQFAWIIDGATGLGDETLLPGQSDAAWLTAVLGEAFGAHAKDTADPLSLFTMAAAEAERRFLAERKRPAKERYELPTAAVLMAAFHADRVEIAELGDCAIYLNDRTGLARYGGSNVGRVLEQNNAKRLMGGGGGRSPEVLAFLRAVRNKANTEDGYAILAPERHSAERARCHTHRWSGTGYALMVTDGYEAAMDDYGLYRPQGFIDAARASIRGPLDALREVERADPDCTRFPRFKPSDDATALLLRSGPVQP